MNLNNPIALIGTLIIALFLALFLGSSIAQEDYIQVYLAFLLMGTPMVLFIMKKNYWVFIPFALLCGLPAIPLIPGRSVALKEIWIALSLMMFLGQIIISRNRNLKLTGIEFIPIYVITAWVVVTFFLDGAGLAILGSSDMGGRKYVGIILAVLSLLIISQQKVSEAQCKLLIRIILAATFVASIVALVNYFFFRVISVEKEQWASQYYTYHQILSNFPLILITYIFSKYTLPELIIRTKIKATMALAVSYPLILYSGKRMHLVLAIMIPVIASIIRKQYMAAFAMCAAAVLFICGAIASVSMLDKLPGSVERAFSFIDYIPGVEFNSNRIKTTNFRETLNEIAIEKIQKHPFIGNGLSVSEAEVLEYEAMEQYALEDVDSHAYLMAAGSSWHNTWLGISTDFGIPCTIIFAIFWLQLFRYAFQLRRQLPVGSYARLLVTFLLIMNLGALLQSWVAGHSLEDILWQRGWQFGVLLALRLQLRDGAEQNDFRSKQAIN